uniref:non-specific serine/threonine protein kinase n=1 Tax=Takifugu rubripes TaxID=31033 RepID=A0A674NFQ4_TAKRU
ARIKRILDTRCGAVPFSLMTSTMLCSSLQVINGELHCVPLEMILMVMTAGDSVGENAVISPLAWTDHDDEVLLIMERPENCMDLLEYDEGQIDEGLAKVITLAIVLRWTPSHCCRARSDNIFGLRILDFGCGWFVTPGYPFSFLTGTSCYEPPEFNLRGTYEAGPTTVWQLGCILLEPLSVNTDMFTTGIFCANGHFSLRLPSSDCKKFLMSCLLIKPDQRITLGQMWCHPMRSVSPGELH